MYLFLEKDRQALAGEIDRLATGLRDLQAADVHVYLAYRAGRYLKYLRNILSQAEVVAPMRGDLVGIGSVVKTNCSLGNGSGKNRSYEEFGVAAYEIGSYLVFSSTPGRISCDSWIGRGLLGAHAGQTRRIDWGAVDVGGGKILTDFTLEVLEVVNA